MKKTLLLGVSLLCSVFIMATEIPFQKAEIKSIMRKVADWQIADPHPAPEHDDLAARRSLCRHGGLGGIG